MSVNEEKGETSKQYEVSEKLAPIQSLIVKELDLEESVLNKELSNINDNEENTDSNMEDILLNEKNDSPLDLGDSDNQDDDLKLTWEDDLEEEAALLEDPVEKVEPEIIKSDTKFQDVIKTIEEEEKILETLDIEEANKNLQVSAKDNLCTPKPTHGLNKPDMMLEIPTQEFIEFSDEEGDLINNLEMSPDEVLENEEESKNIDEEMLLGSDDEKSSEPPLLENETCTDINKSPCTDLLADDKKHENTVPDAETEVKLAAAILTKELCTMDNDNISDQQENILLQDDQEEAYGLLDSDQPPDSENSNCDQELLGMNDESVTNFKEINVNNKNDTNMVLLSENKSNQDTVKPTQVNEAGDIALEEESENVKCQDTEMNPKLTISKNSANIEIEDDIIKSEVLENILEEINLDSKEVDDNKDEDKLIEIDKQFNQEIESELIEQQPSTSYVTSKIDELIDNNKLFNIENENSMCENDVNEMSDSLGLLAETSRVMEEDEEQEDYEDGEEDDDFDHYEDESSQQMTADNSEDSNAQQSETDTKVDIKQKDFKFTINNVTSNAFGDIVGNDSENEQHEMKEETEDLGNPEDSNDANATEHSSIVNVTKDVKDDDILKKMLSDMEDAENSIKEEMTLDNVDVKQSNEIQDTIVNLEESSSDEERDRSSENPQIEESLPPDNIELDMTDENEATDKDVQEDKPTSPCETKIPEEEGKDETEIKKSQVGLEVYNLDSDEEETCGQNVEMENELSEEATTKEQIMTLSDVPKCINKSCPNTSYDFHIADSQAIFFYDGEKKKRMYICQVCLDVVEVRNQELINGMKNFTPLLKLSPKKSKEELVEISDSESEGEVETDDRSDQLIGEDGGKIIEEKLVDMINETWIKFKMDERLKESKNTLQDEFDKIEKESKELNDLLNECQAATDKLRNDLYKAFEPSISELPSLTVYDTPTCSYSCTAPASVSRVEKSINTKDATSSKLKRTRSPSKDVPSKRPAIPLGYAQLDEKELTTTLPTTDKMDDDLQDVSVVKLSAESAPKDLPPPGEVPHVPLKVGMCVYAMKKPLCPWMKARIVEIAPKGGANTFTICRVKFEHKMSKQLFKTMPAKYLAYLEPPDVRLTIGRRVIALFKDHNKQESFYSGIVAEIPNPVNSYRYLIFFDDGYAQYAPHAQVRLVAECAALVWDDVLTYSREFVRQYLLAYPERPMVRLHAGQSLKTEWQRKWWSSKVLRVDASLVEVQFLETNRTEWIYRGSTRLAPLYLEFKAAERHRPRAMPRTQLQSKTNMPYVEYTRSDEQSSKGDTQSKMTQQQHEELRRQRAVAKKSTTTIVAPPPQQTVANVDSVCSRVVYYTPKSAVKPFKMVPHTCSPSCKRKDVLALKDLRTYNPLAKPLLSGWERQIVRWKCHKEVMYKSPCGRRLRNMKELHKYLSDIQSDMAVDLFDFSPVTHCLAEFVLNNTFIGKKDLSHGKENVPVPCVNYYDNSLPEFCSYNTERTPTAGVPLNLDPEFLCGCDCEDDCEDKTKCACWQMTLEGAKTIGLEGDHVGYVYKRLPEPLPSGIYECNSRCKCKHTCLNRVAQHPLQLKLQVFKTANRGWGIRALNDIPKGAFLCVYAGNLLTDATANLDGLNEGDEYLAELDYIEVVEQMKEGYEEDIPEKLKKLDKESNQPSEESDEEMSSEAESNTSRYEERDDDFQPGNISNPVLEFNKRLRRRDSKKDKEDVKETKDVEKKVKDENQDEDCITISDDEEVREPSCFTAAAGMGASEFVSKYRSVRSLFGADEACYIMDAKVQGNIGRYLNHSCAPNVFVQNVFVDTHDPRFPWVAFFALSYIKAGTELTWNYNYDVGSVPGKVLYCYCGAPNCRGRLL